MCDSLLCPAHSVTASLSLLPDLLGSIPSVFCLNLATSYTAPPRAIYCNKGRMGTTIVIRTAEQKSSKNANVLMFALQET